MLVNGDVRKNNEFDGMIMAVATPRIHIGCCMNCANKCKYAKKKKRKSVCDDKECHCVANCEWVYTGIKNSYFSFKALRRIDKGRPILVGSYGDRRNWNQARYKVTL